MGKMMRLRALLSLDFKTVLLLIEATLLLGWARIRIIYQPFSKIAPTLGQYMKETESETSADHRQSLVHIRHAIQIASSHTPWDSKCLARALAGMKMLERRGISSTLYLGTAKDEAGKLIAHAWLRSGSLYVTGAEEMDRFAVTGIFAKVVHY
ncbi:lasso peptide biosynthesis B2 protein [Paenibacillus sp. PL91]|uniref:lasso peptide biosynthesis B2 protein n=1 Tax=Paenibacillus sp. PL91 TaxID=2729538 RepID=UPI00145EC952|nr:lasso peptide biosynthesis B2 protein [Paenibacillus sp. PL91]MBC9203200.1 lasso peptide biosynthesis B2 protein [Paenibacillus sp. PL91]